MTNLNWTQVAQKTAVRWRANFHKSKKGLDVEGNCPICDNQTLHRWFMKGRPIEQIIDGNRFVAQGGLWEWCSSCGTFEHYSALVPDWWQCDLNVDLSKLKFTPEAIEEARQKRFG